MHTQTSRYLELLELRITLLDSLSKTLLAARTAIVAFDIDALESQVAEQQQLCREIQALDEQVERLEYQCAAHLRLRGGQATDDTNSELDDAIQRLHRAQANVKRLNDLHQTVLRRSQRTILALLYSLRTFEGTYQETALLQTANRAELQERA
jgi:FlgN protein